MKKNIQIKKKRKREEKGLSKNRHNAGGSKTERKVLKTSTRKNE